MNQGHPKNATSVANGKPIDLDSLGVEPAEDYYHAPSERFLVRNSAGRWLPHSRASYRMILASRGIKTRAGQGESISEADHQIHQVINKNDVSGYGPLCGRNSGFIEECGYRFLVTEDMSLIPPAEGSCETILAVLKGLICSSETEEIGDAQLNTFLGWLQSSIIALRAGRRIQQQALALCGVEDCGKSLVQHLIVTPCLAGRSADAKLYFLRGNDFNADLFKAEHLFLDDCKSSISTRDRVEFGTKLKEHTVGGSVKSYHAKGKDAFNIRPWWLISISLNDDPESLLVLPPMGENVANKIILLRCSRFDMPMPTCTQEDKDSFAAAIAAEISAFLHYLIHVFKLPENYVDSRRYGVLTFHHPELRESLDGMSPESELLELIDLAFAEDFRSGKLHATAAKIEERITFADRRRAERILHYSNSCGTFLGRLAKKHPERIAKGDTAAKRGWWLFPPE